MKKYLSPILKMGSITALAMASIQSTQASTVVHFLDLNDEDGASNTVNVGGSTLRLGVVRTTSSGNYTYAVTYTGMDYDGDTVNDTLQFNVTVVGYTNSSIVFGGNNDSVVSLATPSETTDVFLSSVQGWIAGHGVRFLQGNTLEFTVDSIEVSGTTLGAYRGTLAGFSQVLLQESANMNHQGSIGVGAGLEDFTFSQASTNISVSPVQSPLYVTSNNTIPNEAKWGVGNIDFNITIAAIDEPGAYVSIPEPASYALLGGLLSIGYMAARRRRR